MGTPAGRGEAGASPRGRDIGWRSAAQAAHPRNSSTPPSDSDRIALSYSLVATQREEAEAGCDKTRVGLPVCTALGVSGEAASG